MPAGGDDMFGWLRISLFFVGLLMAGGVIFTSSQAWPAEKKPSAQIECPLTGVNSPSDHGGHLGEYSQTQTFVALCRSESNRHHRHQRLS